MISMWKKFLKTLRREERGITGLETAIILIAFVVIASIFAYTVLSAGIFSSQKGQAVTTTSHPVVSLASVSLRVAAQVANSG